MRTGVLLCNLGTPDQPTRAAVRRYLAEFLWDPRVVELPRWLWWPVLHGVILRVRPSEVAHKYGEVWLDAGSPLRVITDQQATALQHALGDRARVVYAMRYGNPSIAAGLARLRDSDCERVIVLPLYPQYSSSTTASVYDAVFAALQRERVVPELTLLRGYHDADGYIGALAASVREHWEMHGRGEKLLMSFHGVPQRYVDAGDPYQDECVATARLLADALGLTDDDWLLTFQSRFGREPWLQPYTDVTLRELAARGVKRVDVICPGFAADCLETLEEISLQNRELYTQAGGDTLSYVPALNARADHIAFLQNLVSQWL